MLLSQKYFLPEQTFFNVLFMNLNWYKHLKLIRSIHQINTVQLYITFPPIDYLVYCHPSCTRILYQLSRTIMVYFILRFKQLPSTVLVEMSTNCRPYLHKSSLCILYFSPFIKNFTLLSIWLVCLVPLT